MSETKDFLAVDLGASSGRVIWGQFDGSQLRLSEIHRFANFPVQLNSGLHWDILRLWTEIKQGITKAVSQEGSIFTGLGLDTWGVDFGLLDKTGALIGNPYHYRDARTDGMIAAAFQQVPREEIFAQTGIQFMQLNTLYQLLAMRGTPALEAAHTLLLMPDLFNYWLTGQKAAEFSIATTTQCCDPRQADWAWPMLEKFGIPGGIFPEIIPSGTLLGGLLPEIVQETGASGLQVVAPACHDTGSAVAAVPAAGGSYAWISSGTWSIMGVTVDKPVINPQVLEFNLTNEGGVGGTIRLSKNIVGLWLVQECRRLWTAQGDRYSWDQLTEMAAAAPPLTALIDPDHHDFLMPGDMPARIQAFCRRTNQPVPQSKGAIIRCALESIALRSRWVLSGLETILGYPLEKIHIIGGGTQNLLLNQMIADAANRPVIAGPIEATAIGNILMQMLALGHISSLAEGREIVANSFPLTRYQPAAADAWEIAYQRFLSIAAAG